MIRSKVCYIRQPHSAVYKDMIEDTSIFQALTSHPVLIASDISGLRLNMISQEVNISAYNNSQY